MYYDSKLGVKFMFDPATLIATVHGTESDFPEQLDEQWQTYKNGIQGSIDEYVSMHYRDGTARASLCFNQDGNLQIDISCINLKLEACWGGEWQAQWIVDTQNNQINGHVNINNHYFEEGNIQFNLSKDFGPIPIASADGPNIVKAIKNTETSYQNSVEEILEEGLKDGIFKRMRRILPVTGSKFNWNKPKLLMN